MRLMFELSRARRRSAWPARRRIHSERLAGQVPCRCVSAHERGVRRQRGARLHFMHEFSELADRSAAFTLKALNDAQERLTEALQESGATALVKSIQMVQLQKVISAIGMFSMFEAMLQEGLSCSDGFRGAADVLKQQGEIDLMAQFEDLQIAINALKHGKGRSYDALVKKAANLTFRVKLPHEDFFCEGDVSEVSTLVEVDDAFVLRCTDVIRRVSVAMGKAGHFP